MTPAPAPAPGRPCAYCPVGSPACPAISRRHGAYCRFVDPASPAYEPGYWVPELARMAAGLPAPDREPDPAPAYDPEVARAAEGCRHRLDAPADLGCGCRGVRCGPLGRRPGDRVGIADCYRCTEERGPALAAPPPHHPREKAKSPGAAQPWARRAISF